MHEMIFSNGSNLPTFHWSDAISKEMVGIGNAIEGDKRGSFDGTVPTSSHSTAETVPTIGPFSNSSLIGFKDDGHDNNSSANRVQSDLNDHEPQSKSSLHFEVRTKFNY